MCLLVRGGVALGLVVSLALVGGCSLLYDPSDLPNRKDDAGIDAPPDAELILDADPTALALDRVSPVEIFEGTGADGGRRALLTVHGRQLVDGARIVLTRHGGGATPAITVHDAETQVQDNGLLIAVPITVEVDATLAANQRVRLDVTVVQPGPAGDVSVTLEAVATPVPDSPALELVGLGELEGDAVQLPPGTHEFSRVDVTGGLSASAATDPLIVRARGGITITGLAHANATGRTGGPGGGNGGEGGTALSAPTAGVGDGGGKANGGGGGFGTAGQNGTSNNTAGPAAGMESLPVLGAPNRGSGGGGGAVGLGGAGGDGGGGGGVLELTAGGALVLDQVQALGGAGGGGNNVNKGGGGSGGALLLRGSTITATSIAATGGPGGDATTGDGGAGRIRIDAKTALAPASTPAAYRGPVFAATTPLIVRDPILAVTVFGQPSRSFQYFVENEDATQLEGPFTRAVGPQGTNTFTLDKPLFRGRNRLCTIVEGGSFSDLKREAFDCVEVVYLFQQTP